MAKNQKHIFCEQLAAWLSNSEWHFTTLISTCINAFDRLPNNLDHFINCLLLSYPAKPTPQQLSSYVNQSAIIKDWFKSSTNRPRTRVFNLDLVKPSPANDCLPQFNSPNELAVWLGISFNQLEWFADRKRIDHSKYEKFKHYYYSTVDKRRGGTRLIESPKGDLKYIQRQLAKHILAQAPIHNAAHGFREYRNCRSHAQHHTNKEFVFTFDLANHFHSITWFDTYKIFLNLAYDPDIAEYLSCLCTHKFQGSPSITNKLSESQIKQLQYRRLPQGAPTSPALSNIAMYALDTRLNSLAKSLHLTYSRYADDLVFSTNRIRDWRFLTSTVGSICLEEGFELNYKKSRTLRSHQRQKITGIVVNQRTNIDRRYYDQLKATLTNCVRHGVKDQNLYGHTDFKSHLLGSIAHVKSLNRSRGLKLLDIYNKISF